MTTVMDGLIRLNYDEAKALMIYLKGEDFRSDYDKRLCYKVLDALAEFSGEEK